MVGEVFVEFGGYFTDLAEVPPWAGREVVVLDVVTEVYVRNVPPTDVIVRLLPFYELVVLGNYVDCGRVRTNRTRTGYQGKQQGVHSPEVENEVVGQDDENVVAYFVCSDAGVVHEDRSKGVEYFDYGVEDVFVPGMVVGEFALPGEGQVGVLLQLVQEVVVVGVVPSEGDGTRDAHRDVADHSNYLVQVHVAASAEVSEVVDTAVQSVVEETSHEVGIEQNEPDAHVLSTKVVTLDR